MRSCICFSFNLSIFLLYVIIMDDNFSSVYIVFNNLLEFYIILHKEMFAENG